MQAHICSWDRGWTAAAITALAPDPSTFRRGRDFAARVDLIPSLIEVDSGDSQKPTNLNRWSKLEVCDGFSDFFAFGLRWG